MNLGAIVEVAIGIIFVWITLSLATIQIQEWITTMLDKRASDMAAAIHEMLANPNLGSQLYDHPVIRGLTARKRSRPSPVPPWFYNLPIVRGLTTEKRKLPSYIPAQQFSLCLFDIAMTAGTESSLIQQGIFKIRDDLEKNKKKPKDQAVIDALNILADLARSAAATEAGTSITNITLRVLEEKVREFSRQYPEHEPLMERALAEAKLLKKEIEKVVRKQKASNGDDAILTQLKDGIAALSVISPELNQTLSSLLLNLEQYVAGGESNIARARKNVEKWFDDSMDRVSGVFKRYSQTMALLIGIMIASILNVDSINLTAYLWREPSVRQVLAANAENFQLPEEQLATDPEQTLQAFRDQFAGLSLPIGWVVKDNGPRAIYNSNCQLFPGQNQGFGIPIVMPIFAGDTTASPDNPPQGIKRIAASVSGLNKLCISPPQSNDETNILLKIFGILLTAVAARQGAPFWFDILKRLVNVRATGANPVEKGAGK
jgi:hypothetical protein